MEKIKIAIQKSGRLSDKSIKLLNDAGIKTTNGNRKLISLATNFPLEILFLRDDDIPQYVADGVADLGILGENEFLEKGFDLKTIEKLGFAKCRMSLAIPREEEYTGVSFLEGKKIATSYPVILKNYLNENGISADIESISGSVEIAPGIGLADCIFDIVSTGSTLISNGLKEVDQVLKSEAILISNNELSESKQKIVDELLFRIRAVRNAESYKYILLNAPNENLDQIIASIPGMKSPSIIPLANSNWSSLHSVVKEKEFWEIVGQLRELGAQGILVTPIEKMIL